MEQFRTSMDCDFAGVYTIVNLDKHKVYIGSSRNIKERVAVHRAKLKSGKHPIRCMQADFNSGDNFIAYAITEVAIESEKWCECNNMKYLEREAIKEFDAINPDHGYNIRDNKYNKSPALEKIKYAKSDLDFYFNMFNENFPISEIGRMEEKETFIKKVLCDNKEV